MELLLFKQFQPIRLLIRLREPRVRSNNIFLQIVIDKYLLPRNTRSSYAEHKVDNREKSIGCALSGKFCLSSFLRK